MPKQTFYNLSEEKKNIIINAAKKEFSENNFYEATIKKIIKDAGIPRGSFYQYFDSKEDLFLFLFHQGADIYIKDVKEVLEHKKLDLFEMHLLIFDIVTKNRENDSWRNFFVTTISNMNINLIMHFESYLIEGKYKEPTDFFDDSINWEDYGCQTEKEKKIVHHMIVSSMLLLLGACLHDTDNIEEYRSALVYQLDIIKKGLLKK